MRTKTLLIAAAALAAAVTSSQAQTVYSQNVVGYVNTALPAGVYTLVCNPLNGTTNAAESILSGFVGGETVLLWNGGGYYAYSYAGSGVGTGLGFQSDWEDGASVPPAHPAIPGDQTDASDSVYWAPQPILSPGAGFFVLNPNGNETNTFTGTVITTNNTTIHSGVYQLLASAIPVAGSAESNNVVNLTSAFVGGETVLVWNGGGYYAYSYAGPGVGTGLGFQSDWEDGASVPPAHPAIPGDQTDASDSVYWAPDLKVSVGQGFFVLNPNSTEQWSQTITNIP